MTKNNKLKEIINKLYKESNATREELSYLIENIDEENKNYMFEKSKEVRIRHYGKSVYLRGLIEFTNYCKMNCKYCGIRADNKNADRYRLSKEQILQCARLGYKLGYKTFVLQGGEDPFFTDEKLVDIVSSIKAEMQDVAITMSVGERSYDSYKKIFEAGADRYLLRHETATKSVYEKLHPKASFENRRKCLENLREIGYQIGAGFMVGLPNETVEDKVNNLIYIKKLNPDMCGIGPFIPQKDTPLQKFKGGTLDDTLLLLSIIRLMLPTVLLPATTALGTIDPTGREKGLKVGCNVVMPNLSPTSVRDKYALYDGKICTGDEAAECRGCIERRINFAGYEVEIGRGDNIIWTLNHSKDNLS